MKMIHKSVVAVVLVLVLLTSVAAAENDFDVRLKAGTAAQISELKIDTASGSIGGEPSTNGQVEVMYSHYITPTMSLIVGGGIFSRKHSGSEDLGVGNGNTKFDYDAKGLSLTGGIGTKATENLRLEGKLEVGAGTGKASLSTPGMVWNSTDDGTYTSASLIFGGYYSFAKPGIEMGLEIGSQSFIGDWKIWNNNGYWTDSQVKGTSFIANLVLGYRF